MEFGSLSHHDGHIEVVFGPMFSGKSTELLRRIRRHTIANRKCLVIKYSMDNRYSEDCMSTHDRQMIHAQPCKVLREVNDMFDDYDIIGIDEGQFFPDLVEMCEKFANRGKTVIVAALDGTFQRKAFGSVLELIPLAEKVTKLTAVCSHCFKDASFTKRLGNETAVEVIGGAEKYLPVCRACFYDRPVSPRSESTCSSDGESENPQQQTPPKQAYQKTHSTSLEVTKKDLSMSLLVAEEQAAMS
eukprot:GILJ01009943.1.p1 GENE.GILJ01009943.1~~GILJ01009943.1.p1  ORF type:complete len:253 (+),score=26.85 GILJ01009943.1:28-759(+)